RKLKMSIEGKGRVKRNSSMVFMNVGTTTEEYELLGKGIGEMSRELNNEVTAEPDVLGNIEAILVKGPQTTAVDPVKFERESKVSGIMYDIYKYEKEMSDVEHDFVEVFTEDRIAEGEYAAFKQKGIVDLKSWGGDTSGLNTPFDINWTGERAHGRFNPATKQFTALSA
ncbi:MAG: hypothetical protein FWC68_03670, partial [Oscillospiraceae bacterium]|nr:hypothetical protein [Oscillospiraceae bacterium]